LQLLARSVSAEDVTNSKPGVVKKDKTAVEREDVNSWELVEVGRGLANYNSAQIEKVMGLNSSHISQLLGYADSDYVVENITIRVSP